MQTMWTFKTAHFVIRWEIEPCYDLDLSWDETGEARDMIERGLWEAFDSKISVTFRGIEVGAYYLGDSIYANPSDFRDHIGMNGKGHGSYFSDMVRGAIAEARATLAEFPYMRNAQSPVRMRA